MNEKILIECGLSAEQAKIYLHLIQYGLCPAKVIATKTSTGRALTYKVLDQLIKLDLAEKREKNGTITMFLPKHPRQLKEISEKKKKEIEHASTDLNKIFSDLSSNFNSLLGKPNIQFYEGMDGIEKTYEDILDVGKDISIISAPIHKEKTDILEFIKKQIKEQVSQNIKTRAITPLQNINIIDTVIDEKNLITRKKIPAEKLNIPAQIIIYGDKVSIINFKEEVVTVLIESKYITETFKTMFEYIWNRE